MASRKGRVKAETLISSLHKFQEAVQNIEKCELNHIKKVLRKFESLQFPPNCPPYVKALRASAHLRYGEIEKAAVLIREVEATAPTELTLCNHILHTLRATNQIQDLENLYTRLRVLKPKEAEIINWDISLALLTGNFKKAQESAMALVKLNSQQSHHVFAAGCAYLRAVFEKNPLFYKFAIMFLDKANFLTADLAEMKFKSLLGQNLAQEALTYLRSKPVVEKWSFDKLSYHRMEMLALEKLGDFKTIGELAVKILREINGDLLDEWKLCAKHCENAAEIIDEIAAAHDKYRGPQLARMELALVKGEDVVPLVAAYIEKYCNKPHLLGDIKPYLTDDVIAKLPETADTVINALKKGVFTGEVTDARTAVIKAQELMKEGKLKEAAEICAQYPTEPDTRVTLVRIAGLMNCTAAQVKAWIDQRLEGIQYLSLGNMWVLDAMRAWDFEGLRTMTEKTFAFGQRNESAYIVQHITAALNNYNFQAVESCSKFMNELYNHMMQYLSKLLTMWADFIEMKDEPTAYKIEHMKNKEACEKLVTRIDESVIPIYYKDEKLREIMYPDILKPIQCFSAVMNVLLNMKVNPSQVQAVLDEAAAVTEGTEWSAFVEFVKGGCQNFTVADGSASFMVIGSMILAAKYSETVAAVKDAAVAAITAATEKIQIGEIPEAVLPDAQIEQKKRIDATVELFKKILE